MILSVNFNSKIHIEKGVEAGKSVRKLLQYSSRIIADLVDIVLGTY